MEEGAYNTYIKRKKSIKKTLLLIGFPENLIDDEVYNVMIKIKYDDDDDKNKNYQDNKKVIFKNFSKKNGMNGKFDYNFLKENIDFNIKPLFEKYYISLEEERKLEIFNQEHFFPIYIYILLLKINYLITGRFFWSSDFEIYLISGYMIYFEELNDLFLFKNVYPEFSNINFEVIENYHNINKEDLKKYIFYWLNTYKQLFNQELSKKSFVLSPEVITLDSITLLYFNTLNSIYLNFLKEDIDTSEIDTLIGSFKEKKSNFNIKYSSKKELVYKYFYFYQYFKFFKDSISLIKDKDLGFYKKIFEKTSNYSYRTENSPLLNKKEFMKILNEKDEKNFKRNIDNFEKFIDNFFNEKDTKDYIKKNLDLYSIFYQELFHNRKKGDKNFITTFKSKKNILQSDYYFVNKKLMRSFIINNMSKEKYNKFTSFIENITNIYLNNLYDENASVLFDLIEKSLDLHIKLNFNNELKKIELLLDNIPLNPNIYTTKHKK